MRATVIEATAVYRQGLRRLLRESAGVESVETFACVDAGSDHCLQTRPDVLVFDLEMPFARGLDLIDRIARRCKSTRIVGMYRREHPVLFATAMHLGAHALVPRSASFEELERVIAAESPFSLVPEAPASEPLELCVFITRLTTREREVALRLVEGLSTAGIARELHVSIKTVDTHRRRSLQKLGARNVADLTRLAIADGVSQLTY